jgi:hypothetical protein
LIIYKVVLLVLSSQVSGMDDFFGEMVEMMSQATPTVS